MPVAETFALSIVFFSLEMVLFRTNTGHWACRRSEMEIGALMLFLCGQSRLGVFFLLSGIDVPELSELKPELILPDMAHDTKASTSVCCVKCDKCEVDAAFEFARQPATS